MVGAGLGDEDAVARPQPLDGQRALAPASRRSPLKRAKRMEKQVSGTSRRRVGGDLEEGLRVGDHQARRPLEARRARSRSSRSLTTSNGVVVEQVADGLHLRQDEPALGRLLVDRHDQHGQLARAAPGRRGWSGLSTKSLGRGVEQRLRAGRGCPRPCGATVLHARASCARCSRAGDGRRRPPRSVLLKTTITGTLARAQLVERSPPRTRPSAPASATITPRSVRSKTCRVRSTRSSPERAHVVDAGRVDEQHRPERQQLHRLLDRVGGRAGARRRRWTPAAA